MDAENILMMNYTNFPKDIIIIKRGSQWQVERESDLHPISQKTQSKYPTIPTHRTNEEKGRQ